MNLSEALGDTAKNRPTGHYAAAEGIKSPGEATIRNWNPEPEFLNESEENILQKGIVHVRNDFVSILMSCFTESICANSPSQYMTSEAV